MTDARSQRWVLAVVVGVACACLSALSVSFSKLSELERTAEDWRARSFGDPSRASDNVVIVDIDQASLDLYATEMDLAWPWPRELHGQVIDYLTRDGARCIVLDIFFSTPSTMASSSVDEHGLAITDDEFLGRSIRAGPPVFAALSSGSLFGAARAQVARLDDRLESPDYQVSGMKLPLLGGIQAPIVEVLDSVRDVGQVSLSSEVDRSRGIQLLSGMDGRVVASLALEVVLGLRGIEEARWDAREQSLRAGDLSIPCDRQGRMPLRYHGGDGVYRHYPVANVLANQMRLLDGNEPLPNLPAGTFTDKIVLIGSSAPGLLDRQPTPFGDKESGVGILATAIDNIQSGDHLRPAPAWLWLIELTLIAVCASLLSWLPRVTVALAGVASLVAAHVALILLAYGSWQLVMPILPALVAIVLAFGVPSLNSLVRSREISRKNEQLELLNEQKNQLLGMAAHDLRNPLGVISGYSKVLLGGLTGEMSEQQKEFITKINSSSQFMRGLVDDMLDFSALESGMIRLDLERFDLRELIEESAKMNGVSAQPKNIGIELDETEPLQVQADRQKMFQVVNNLLSNAIKYSHSGTTVYVVAKHVDNHVHLTVRDQGQGIPEDQLERLFKPFQTTSVKTTAGEKSSGLGLTIVRQIVEAHGGRIWVESEVGSGSSFHVTLPGNPGS